MANIPLKSIKFPDLPDTYTVPVVDNTLAVAGAAADAKKTGDELAEKVDKVSGKGLSTNDFTNDEKTKLANIEAGANKTVTDTTLTQSGQAADAKETGDKITSLKKELSEYNYSALISSGYYNLLGSTLVEKTESSSYVTCLLRVLPGEVVRLTGSGANAARLWGTADIGGKILRKAGNAANATDLEITIQEGEAFFVFNATANSIYYPAALHITVDRATTLNNIRGDISHLHEPLLRVECNGLLESGYYPMSSSVIQSKIESDSYVCYKMPVAAGFKFVLSGQGATNGRLWVTTDENMRVKRSAATSAAETNLEVTIAEGEKYFVFNASSTSLSYVPYLALIFNRVVSMSNAATANMSIDSRVGDLEDKTAEYEIRNNLKTDGIINLPGVKCYKNGEESPSNYGLPGTRYVIDVGDYDKLHMFFRFKHNTYIPYTGNVNTYVPIAGIGNNGELNVNINLRNVTTTSAIIYRYGRFTVANGTTWHTEDLNALRYKTPNGKTSIIIRYTGGGEIDANTNIVVTVASESISFVVNGTTLGSIPLVATDSIQSLADAINLVNGFSCEVANSDGTIGDLLLTDMSASLISTTTRGGATVYGLKPFVVPFGMDDEWHTCEIAVDKANQVGYVAYDGLTVTVPFDEVALNNNVVIVGGNHNKESTIKVKDLAIDVGSWGDAEVLTAKSTSSSTTDKTQLISSHNPRVMIFEGHGVWTGSEADAQKAYTSSESDTSEEAMSASTDRLNVIFATLTERGYAPVSMADVLSWHRGTKELPKRCFTCIFDDVRLVNYLDYNNRKPFVKYGVNPTLALITGNIALADTVSANGITYTGEEAINIVSRNGWYICTHTDGHRKLTDYTVSENEELLKQDVLSADIHYIHSDVIVYPFGAVNYDVMSSVALSDFALGVSIVEDRLNCKAISPYRLVRTELGTRSPLTKVLEPFV